MPETPPEDTALKKPAKSVTTGSCIRPVCQTGHQHKEKPAGLRARRGFSGVVEPRGVEPLTS